MCFDITDVFHSQASIIRWKLFGQSVLEGKTHIVEVWLNNVKYEATSLEINYFSFLYGIHFFVLSKLILILLILSLSSFCVNKQNHIL